MEEMIYCIPRAGFSWRVTKAGMPNTTMLVRAGFSHGVPTSEEDRTLRLLDLSPLDNPSEENLRDENLFQALQGADGRYALVEVYVDEAGNIEMCFQDKDTGDVCTYEVYREGLGSEFTLYVCKEQDEVAEMYTLSTTSTDTEIKTLVLNGTDWWFTERIILIDNTQPTIKIAQY